ncbi:MAG: cyclase [Candidatus Omnitrophica bacterium CG11_big_fil_rev_8_21_14_0_20_42_13]|uniref:Cyclase n=1 Tax=Candidatus Ghiorseimicrobium undicola TaxID=1974746 RepID=A0A2H0M0G5_9BACT|nr:MAG: cyclase [Candidatus Omnitrophica bacterium CG11_big_fil_rev_8_21_14_0_20_42_13]
MVKRMKIIDLSLPIDDTAFEVHHVKIERTGHKEGVEKFNRVIMGKTIPGKIKYLFGKRIVKKEDLPDEEFLSLEVVHSPVHIGTHLDYSFHYGSRSEGRASKTAEEIPLEWCIQDGVKLDLRDKKPNEVIKAADIEKCLGKINYQIKPLDIVMLHTGADKLYGSPKYFSDYPGVDISAIDYLLDRGIKIFGVDTMGIDRPYRFMLKEFLDKKDPGLFYPAHFYGRKREFIHIERLANLEKLPGHGFKIHCLPIRIKKTGAAWARVVAFL